MINLDNVLKSRNITLPTKVCLSSQSYGFSSSHVWIWELDHKEGWMLKNWCFWTVVLEQTPENPLDCKEIQPVNPKGNQSWIFIGRTDAEAPILWPPDARSRLIGKDPDAGKDWRQEKKGTTEEEVVGWHHRLNGPAFEQALDGERQGSPECCSPWGHKESDTTERLNNNNWISWNIVLRADIVYPWSRKKPNQYWKNKNQLKLRKEKAALTLTTRLGGQRQIRPAAMNRKHLLFSKL